MKRSHVAIWNWRQRYHSRKIPSKRNKIEEYIVDQTIIKVGTEYIWLWVTIEPENRQILALFISKERNMLIAERFLSNAVRHHGKHPVSTDVGACLFNACSKILEGGLFNKDINKNNRTLR